MSQIRKPTSDPYYRRRQKSTGTQPSPIKQKLPPLQDDIAYQSYLSRSFHSEFNTNKTEDSKTCSRISDRFFTISGEVSPPRARSQNKTIIQVKRIDEKACRKDVEFDLCGSEWDLINVFEKWWIQGEKKKSCKLAEVQSQISYWKQCWEEIEPLISKQKKESLKSLQSLINILLGFYPVYDQIIDEKKQHSQTKIEQLEAQMNLLEQEFNNYKYEIKQQEDKQNRLSAQIKSEIAELFPSSDKEYDQFKNRVVELNQINNSGTIECLKDLYVDLQKQISLPQVNSDKFLSPDEVEQQLLTDMMSLHQSTAYRVLKAILARRFKGDSKEVQTEGTFIEGDKYNELKKQYQQVAYQVKQVQRQKDEYWKTLKEREEAYDKFQSNKHKYKDEVAKAKIEASKVSNEKSKLEKQLQQLQMVHQLVLKEKNVLSLQIMALQEGKDINHYAKEELKELQNLQQNVQQMISDPTNPASEEIQKVVMNQIRQTKKVFKRQASESSEETIDEVTGNRIRRGKRKFSPSQSKETMLSPRKSPTRKGNNFFQNDYSDSQSDEQESSNSPGIKITTTRSSKNPTSITNKNQIRNNSPTVKPSGGGQKSSTSPIKGNQKNIKGSLIRNKSPEVKQRGKTYNVPKFEPYVDENGVLVVPEAQSEFPDFVEQVRIGADGVEYIVIDRAATTQFELPWMIVLNNSKEVQFDFRNPDHDWDERNQGGDDQFTTIYGFNPNQVFGLRGDSYYHSKNQVFQARTIIPSKFKQVYRFG